MSLNVVIADAVATAERAAMNEVARILDYVVVDRGGRESCVKLITIEIRLRAIAGQLRIRKGIPLLHGGEYLSLNNYQRHHLFTTLYLNRLPRRTFRTFHIGLNIPI